MKSIKLILGTVVVTVLLVWGLPQITGEGPAGTVIDIGCIGYCVENEHK